jgi:hypothetical protein
MDIDIKELKRVLKYSPSTGMWTNRVWRGGDAHVGKVTGRLNTDGYMQICYKGKRYMSSRLAHFYMTGEWPPFEMDHKDLDRQNNKWKNLRPATDSQNQMNRVARKNGCKGLTRRKKKWGAFITHEGKRHWLGVFLLKRDAIAARCKAELNLFSTFARLPERLTLVASDTKRECPWI